MSVAKYQCSVCGHRLEVHVFKCPKCFAKNSIRLAMDSNFDSVKSEQPRTLATMKVDANQDAAFKIGMREWDRVVGNGLRPRNLILFGAAPGCGKSTLTLQVCAKFCKDNPKKAVLYFSNEEDVSKIYERALRLNIDIAPLHNFTLIARRNIFNIMDVTNKIQADIIVIDSLNTLFHPAAESVPGGIKQLSLASASLKALCCDTSAAGLAIVHISKSGGIAGSESMEHMADTVLMLKIDDKKKTSSKRILYCTKNREGSTDQKGYFLMQQDGMIEVSDLSEYFIDHGAVDHSDKIHPDQFVWPEMVGVTYGVVKQGERVFCVESQASITLSPDNVKTVNFVGFPKDLGKRCVQLIRTVIRISIAKKNIILRVPLGPETIDDEDLALAAVAAFISSYYELKLPGGVVFIGNIDAYGNVLEANSIDQKIKSAYFCHFSKVICSSLNKISNDFGLEIMTIDNIKELIPPESDKPVREISVIAPLKPIDIKKVRIYYKHNPLEKIVGISYIPIVHQGFIDIIEAHTVISIVPDGEKKKYVISGMESKRFNLLMSFYRHFLDLDTSKINITLNLENSGDNKQVDLGVFTATLSAILDNEWDTGVLFYGELDAAGQILVPTQEEIDTLLKCISDSVFNKIYWNYDGPVPIGITNKKVGSILEL